MITFTLVGRRFKLALYLEPGGRRNATGFATGLLYDIAADPFELHDLYCSPPHKALRDALALALHAWHTANSELGSDLRAGRRRLRGEAVWPRLKMELREADARLEGSVAALEAAPPTGMSAAPDPVCDRAPRPTRQTLWAWQAIARSRLAVRGRL